ncbi:hypothetical protein SNEBB_005307, partial [Seison nebaliae]
IIIIVLFQLFLGRSVYTNEIISNEGNVLLEEGYSISQFGEVEINVNFDYFLIYDTFKLKIYGKTIWNKRLFSWSLPKNYVLTSVSTNGRQRTVYLLLSNSTKTETFIAHRSGIAKVQSNMSDVIAIRYNWKDDDITLLMKDVQFRCSLLISNCRKVGLNDKKVKGLVDISTINNGQRLRHKTKILILRNRPKYSERCKKQAEVRCQFQKENNVSLSKREAKHLSFSCNDVVWWIDPSTCQIPLIVNFTRIADWYTVNNLNSLNLLIFIAIVVMLSFIGVICLWQCCLWMRTHSCWL